MGRPWKYDKLIHLLQDGIVYSTARVVAEGKEKGLFDVSFDDSSVVLAEHQQKDAMKKAASSLSHFVGKHLPREPDGYVAAGDRSRARYPGWLGKRWKDALADLTSNS